MLGRFHAPASCREAATETPAGALPGGRDGDGPALGDSWRTVAQLGANLCAATLRVIW